jgi:hypothetical protein
MAGAKPARLTLAGHRDRRMESGRKCLVWIPVNVLMQVARGERYLENLYMFVEKMLLQNCNISVCLP